MHSEIKMSDDDEQSCSQFITENYYEKLILGEKRI